MNKLTLFTALASLLCALVSYLIYNAAYLKSCSCAKLDIAPWKHIGEWGHISTHS